MVEIVKSAVSRVEIRNVAKSVSQDAKSPKSNGSVGNAGSNVKLNSLESQLVVKDMSSAAPVDKENVNRIKDAIKRGEYLIDLDRVSDALMEAYKEMKS